MNITDNLRVRAQSFDDLSGQTSPTNPTSLTPLALPLFSPRSDHPMRHSIVVVNPIENALPDFPKTLLPLITACFDRKEKTDLEAGFLVNEKRASERDVFESKNENTFITWEELELCGLDFQSQKSFSLDLSDTDITDEELADLAKRFPNIIAIRAPGCKELTHIPLNLKKLKELDLNACSRLTNDAISSMCQNFPQLTHLNVSNCYQLTDDAISAVKNPKQLTHLNVAGCEQLTDDAIIGICQNFPQLTDLDVSGCEQLTDDAIIYISRNLPLLRHLNVSCCERLTDNAIISISRNPKQLTHLNVSMCPHLTDGAFYSIFQNLPQLTDLDVSWSLHLTDAAIIHSESLLQLKHLDISNCHLLTDDAITSICQKGPQLTFLYARFCPHLTDAAFANFDPSVTIRR